MAQETEEFDLFSPDSVADSSNDADFSPPHAHLLDDRLGSPAPYSSPLPRRRLAANNRFQFRRDPSARDRALSWEILDGEADEHHGTGFTESSAAAAAAGRGRGGGELLFHGDEDEDDDDNDEEVEVAVVSDALRGLDPPLRAPSTARLLSERVEEEQQAAAADASFEAMLDPLQEGTESEERSELGQQQSPQPSPPLEAVSDRPPPPRQQLGDELQLSGAGTRAHPVHIEEIVLGPPNADERRILEQGRLGMIEHDRFFAESPVARFIRDVGILSGLGAWHFLRQPSHEEKRRQVQQLTRMWQPPAGECPSAGEEAESGRRCPPPEERALQRMRFYEDPIRRANTEDAAGAVFSDENGIWLFATAALTYLQTGVSSSFADRSLPDLVLSRERSVVTAFAELTALMYKSNAVILEENYKAFDKDENRIEQKKWKAAAQLAAFEWDDSAIDFVRKPQGWLRRAQKRSRQTARGMMLPAEAGSSGLMRPLGEAKRTRLRGRSWTEDPRAKLWVPVELQPAL